jgi:TonB family protein
MIYTMGPGVTAPELLPFAQSPIPVEKCKKQLKSAIPVSLYVDAEGVPRDLNLVFPKESKLDALALKTVTGDRFKPGTYKGLPVPVAVNVMVTLNACIDRKNDSSGQQTDQMRLLSLPEQKVVSLQKPPETDDIASIGALEKIGPGVSAPVVLHSPEAEFTDDARRANYDGICVISMIVDSHGIPQNVRIVKPLDYGLSEKAVEAVKKYRFTPAIKNGKPVPVMVTVEVNFRLYRRF